MVQSFRGLSFGLRQSPTISTVRLNPPFKDFSGGSLGPFFRQTNDSRIFLRGHAVLDELTKFLGGAIILGSFPATSLKKGRDAARGSGNLEAEIMAAGAIIHRGFVVVVTLFAIDGPLMGIVGIGLRLAGFFGKLGIVAVAPQASLHGNSVCRRGFLVAGITGQSRILVLLLQERGLRRSREWMKTKEDRPESQEKGSPDFPDLVFLYHFYRSKIKMGAALQEAFSLVPGPGATPCCPKTMRRLPFHGPGGPPVLEPPWGFPSLVGTTSRSPDRSASSGGNRSALPGWGPAQPMLFGHQAVAPGPRAKYPGDVKPATGGTPGRAGSLP
jgi:hypothetical protein